MAMLKFKKGLWSKLPETKVEGTIYVTTDEKAMYVDISGSERIRLGDIIRLAKMSDLTPPYSTEPFYYIEEDNALLKYVEIKNTEGAVTGHAWKQVNGTQELKDAININASNIASLDERLTNLDKTDGRIASIESRVTAIDAETTGRMAVAEADIASLKATVGTNEQGQTLGGRVTALETEVHGADGNGGLVGKITALETKDGEINEAIEGVKTLLTEHETTAGQTYATKTELTNSKSAILGQTDGVDFTGATINEKAYAGTVKGAFEAIADEKTRAKAAEEVNASAASAASQAAATADAKAVQAGNAAAAADAKAVAADAKAEARLLKTDFQAFEITNSAAIKDAKDAADAAQNAANAAQSKADANETAIGVINGTGAGSISKAVADAKAAAAEDATQKANTAEANAKAYTDTEVGKANQAAATAQSAAEAAQSAANGAQTTANQAVNDAKAAKELAETKATIDEVKALNYATKTEAQGYANAKDTAIAAAQSAAEDAQSDATEALNAIGVLNGDVNTDGSVAKAVAGAVATAAADATQKANTAETNAKTYADGEVAKANAAAAAAKTAAEKNAEDIASSNGADTVEGSVAQKIKVAKEALTNDINSKINAANAMVYRGEVSSTTQLDALSDLSVGDTYVVSSAFSSYNAGDLLVAKSTYTETTTGEIDGKIPSGYLDWDHVTTGYNANLEQTIETVDGKIQLTSAVGAANNGQISFVPAAGSAVTVAVADNTVTIGMAWEDFN